jgi:hypothetical protein
LSCAGRQAILDGLQAADDESSVHGQSLRARARHPTRHRLDHLRHSRPAFISAALAQASPAMGDFPVCGADSRPLAPPNLSSRVRGHCPCASHVYAAFSSADVGRSSFSGLVLQDASHTSRSGCCPTSCRPLFAVRMTTVKEPDCW